MWTTLHSHSNPSNNYIAAGHFKYEYSPDVSDQDLAFYDYLKPLGTIVDKTQPFHLGPPPSRGPIVFQNMVSREFLDRVQC